MNFMKEWYAGHANPFNEKGKLSDVIAGADMFIGLAGPGLITVDDLKKMAKDPKTAGAGGIGGSEILT